MTTIIISCSCRKWWIVLVKNVCVACIFMYPPLLWYPKTKSQSMVGGIKQNFKLWRDNCTLQSWVSTYTERLRAESISHRSSPDSRGFSGGTAEIHTSGGTTCTQHNIYKGRVCGRKKFLRSAKVVWWTQQASGKTCSNKTNKIKLIFWLI